MNHAAFSRLRTVIRTVLVSVLLGAAHLHAPAMEPYARVVVPAEAETTTDNVISLQQADTDLDGITYIAGTLRGGASFSPNVVIPPRGFTIKNETNDLFIARLSTSGAWLSARRIFSPLGLSTPGLNGPALTAPTNGIQVNDIGIGVSNVYVAGTLRSSRRVGFVIKLDPAGTVVWTRFVIAATNATVNTVAEGPGGVVYVGGGMRGAASLVGARSATTLGVSPLGGAAASEDAFIARLTAAGELNWFVNTTSGAAESEEVTALEVDGLGEVHALVSILGERVNINHRTGTVFSRDLRTGGTTGTFAGKLGTDGVWQRGRLLGSSDLGAFPANTILGRDLRLVGGKVFVAGSFKASKLANVGLSGFITRLSAEDYQSDGLTAYLTSGGNPRLDAFPARLRGAGRDLFVTGRMPITLSVYGNVASSDDDPGTVDEELISLRAADFVGAFDTDLNPRWLRTTSRPESVPPPEVFNGGMLAFDSSTRKLFWGGDFSGQRPQKMLLGDLPDEVDLFEGASGSPFPGTSPRGWVTAFDTEGRAIRLARLTVDSAVPPILIDDVSYNTSRFTESFLEGAVVRIAVTDRERDGTRNLTTGYTLDKQTGVTPSRSLTATLLQDTTVTFHWITQHRLTIESDHSAAGLLDTASAGNPEPLFGITWIDDGARVDAKVDGFVEPSDAALWGTRYVVRSYEVVTGSGTNVTSIGQVTDRVYVAPLRDTPMSGPVTLRYRWKKQHRLGVEVSDVDANALVISRQTSSPTSSVTGTGVLWFDDRSTVELLARGTNSSSTLLLRGWDYATPTPDYFPSSQFAASEELDVATQLRGPGSLSTTNIGGAIFYLRRIQSFDRPGSVVWSYGDPLFSYNVTVGSAFKWPTLAGKGAVPTTRWTQIRVIDGPPGSTGEDMMVWDPRNRAAIPTRPGIFLVDLEYGSGSTANRVVLQLYTGFTGAPFQNDPSKLYFDPVGFQQHVVGTPPVNLDPDPSDGEFFRELRYSTANAVVAQGRFTASSPGLSVLVLSRTPGDSTRSAVGDPLAENLVVRVVNSEAWSNVVETSVAPAVVGSPLTSTRDTAGIGTGYVVNPAANYNPDIYDREVPSGPIIPVNNRVGTPDINGPRELVVVWYQKAGNVLWPWKPVFYPNFTWPTTDRNRIVIASRLGSEGLDASGQRQRRFEPESYDDLRIYHQPDPDQPGYNPNEEHARVYPSLHAQLDGRTVPAAFALRDDLNVTRDLISASGGRLALSDYTSDPFVLVQFTEKATGKPGMAVYAVGREDSSTRDPWVARLPGASGDTYTFSYNVVAGKRLAPPYPLDLVMGLAPCVNTVPNLFSSPDALPNGTYFLDFGTLPRASFVDHKNGFWAVAGDSVIRAFYAYPLAPDFWYPFDLDSPTITATGVGDCVPWLPQFSLPSRLGVFDRGSNPAIRGAPIEVRHGTVWPENPPVLKVGETLTYAGGEYQADVPEAPGLPGILGFAAAEVVYDSKNPRMNASSLDGVNWFNSYSARVIAPLEERRIAVRRDDLPAAIANPATGNVRVEGDAWYFTQLPPSLQRRVLYRPLDRLTSSGSQGVLVLRGFVNDRTLGAGDLTAAPPPVYVVEPNVLTPDEVTLLKGLGGATDTAWSDRIDALFVLSRNPAGLDDGGGHGWNVGLEQVGTLPTSAKPLRGLGPGLALVTNPRLLDPAYALDPAYGRVAWVTVAENNHPSLGDAPVTLHVILIRADPAQRYRGVIKTLLPENVFDEKITLRHSADFGGNVDQVAFGWWYREADGAFRPGDVPPGGSGAPRWDSLGNDAGERGRVQIDLGGNPTLLLADQFFFVRYRYDAPAFTEADWSNWAGAANSSPRDLDGDQRPDLRPQLAMGWVKRVLDAVNPYEARIRQFGRADSPATASSMIQQLGSPYTGPVALNASKDVVENLGLVELYETVLARARGMTVDGTAATTSSGINAALLLASTRLAEFYTLLGHSAWDDALDPTLGYGNQQGVAADSLTAARFCFENQVPNLLSEELALLRGRDESLGRPVFNRLFWNFTKGEGEVAYAVNYQLADVNGDGFIDENDALRQYPMGHGDAWGHYLSAMRKRYDLLRTPGFTWESRGEYYNLLDTVLGVDFDDERSFARTAAARAQVGAEIVQLTFRSRYGEAPDSKLTGYTDTDRNRAWGVTEWARRTAQAAYFDWVTANSLLPASDPAAHRPASEKVDRGTVTEIQEIATHFAGIQIALDSANSGLNAIGLDPDVLPFDLDPTHIDVGSTAQIGRQAVQGLSHFEQIFERAVEAMRNASVSFDQANRLKARNREVEQSADTLRRAALRQDLEYRNRLIEIFGTPYDGQIGAGKAYPAGYAGPDLNLFMYVDVNDVTPETVPVANSDTYFDEYVSFYSLTNDIPEAFRADLTEHFLDDISLEGNTAVELLGDDLVHLRLPATAATYTFVAPENWGQRAAPGRLQAVVGEILQVQAELGIAVGDYDFLIKQLRDRVSLLRMRAGVDAEVLGIKEEQLERATAVMISILAFRATARGAGFGAEAAESFADAIAEALPTSVGTSIDATAPARSAIKIGGWTIAANVLRALQTVAEQGADTAELSRELLDLQDELEIDEKERGVELRGMLHEIEELLVNEGVTRMRLFSIREQLRGLVDQYRATLQEGIRLVDERRNAQVELAAAAQGNRYHDLLFRGGRHESIVRYRALFDIAQRYAYLAAKAYDYETNFDPRDRASALPLLDEIVRTRALGVIGEGLPAAGPGLAGVMARLHANFRAVEGRLGFNNFQLDTTEFSLRHEAFRKDSAEDWRATLSGARVENLWDVPDFRRFCRPFAAPPGEQPALVLRFSTRVASGYNFFGRFLGARDSAYDPSLYATKIRAAGLRFEGYPHATLARTPYVYLVPAGLDFMTIPNSDDLEPRSWKIIDQAIPVPFPTGGLDLSREGWLPGLDSLTGAFGEIRRFSSFRAGVLPEDPRVNVTRFIGRSVWNDSWLLVIPGRSLHFNAAGGLDDFIAEVSDIKLTFETYGYSGN